MGSTLFSFHLTLSEPEPPSINKLYSTGRHGQRFLTKAGAAFKSALTQEVVKAVTPLPWVQAVDAVYKNKATVDITIILQFPVFNASWKPGAKTKSGEMQSPYKKKDILNYGKVIEDAVAEGTGIDDSAHFWAQLGKREGAPLVEVYYAVVT